MYRIAKLKRTLCLNTKAKLPDIFSAADGPQRIVCTLLENFCVNRDYEVVNQLVQAGDLVFFRRGERIIREGELDNDVYFLLVGSVDIVVKLQRGSIREAPNQVGEMSAIELGRVRTATVVARSDEVAALRVSGISFRHIWSSSVGFQERLQVEMSSRHRERILAGKVARSNNSFFWFLISLGVGFFAGVVAWYTLPSTEWTSSARSVTAGGIALLSFVFTLLYNPAFFWRRVFWIVLLSMITSITFGQLVTINAQQGFSSLQVELNYGGQGTDWISEIVKAVCFLAVLSLCAYMDKKRTED